MAAVRRAEVTWEGDLAHGSGQLTAESSGAFTDLPVTWGSRIERADGRTSPEELLAAAHASCFAMALSFGLGNAGTPPERLQVSAEVTFDRVEGGLRVISSALTVRGRVAGLEADAFRQAAEGAKENCPISQALKGNVQLSVEASLESS
jgi:lipoyl-dependent peroxiredoxin